MPKEMGAIGTSMHRAASRSALAAKDAELDGGLHNAFSALSEVMQQCRERYAERYGVASCLLLLRIIIQ